MQRAILTLWLILSLIGCTSMQVSQGNKLPAAISTLKAGDTVTVITYSGVATTLIVSSINGRTLTGQSEGKVVSIPVVQIKAIERPQFSPGKTIGIFAGVVYVVVAVLAAMGFYALSKATK